MSIKVGINGFGRIGRLSLRAAWDWPEVEFVHINDPHGDANSLAHLLEFDSIQGRWQHATQAGFRASWAMTNAPLVSTDYCGDARSAIIDALSTLVINDTQVKLYAWYDNEWGYANRTAELVRYVGLQDQA